MSRKKKILVAFLTVLPLLVVIVYIYLNPVSFFVNQEAIREYVLRFGFWAPLIFIGVQVVQVVVTPISHYVVGIVGGMLFGVWWGSVLNWIGRVIGHSVAFFLARKLGKPVANRFVGEKNLNKYDALWRKSGGAFTLFLIYFLPLFPDDEISYIVGLSSMPYKYFLIANILGHTMGAAGLAMIGAGLVSNNKWMLVVYGVVFFGLFMLWFLRKRLEKLVFKKSANN